VTGSTDANQLRLWLAEARQAKHEIATGTKVSVWMDQNGERVEYSRANMGVLQAYIAELEADLAAAVNGASRPTGPLTFWM
jgi:hypothetical protein